MVIDLENYTQHFFQSRLEHSLSVSYYSYRIGRRMGLNYTAMARGGLLHDLFHYDRKKDSIEIESHCWMHPRIALMNAKQITEVSKLEEDIIINHMMGSTRDLTKSKEAFIVSMVDKYLAMSEVSRGIYFSLFKNKTPRRLLPLFLLMD